MPHSSCLTIPPRNRRPSNITKRGFNEPTDSLLGFPCDFLPSTSKDEDILDPSRNAAWLRHDLALKYCYEAEVAFSIEGEHYSFPIVRTVYRRDRDLRKSEIVDFIKSGAIPPRYPPRDSNGVVNEPMNAENFRQMVSRFFVHTYVAFGRLFDELRERSTRRIVQRTPHHLEERFWSTVAVFGDWDHIGNAAPHDILSEVLRCGGEFWYLNALQRCSAVSYRIRTGRNASIPPPMCEDGFSDP
ncbi:hypothetical protein B0H15DRAFT_953613 [Mycena belliarum]|uniref:Uncharacterized protein n=1 Tax=Mycena belliarum TaxID=1033014 RepID=A0AAD6TU12_9AGAR|nr:hypothetical protein B0H15DRAFT_956544 [Mycena belliae]KAJ7080429.1 hypothetical protein B0H15DRAFT_953613 [Mycena belliae]